MQLQPSVGTHMQCFCSYFSLKPYVVTPHVNRLDEMVQTCFDAEITKIIPNYHQIFHLILSSGFEFPLFENALQFFFVGPNSSKIAVSLNVYL